MDMEDLCGINLQNSFPTNYQESGIPYTVQYDPSVIVGSYPYNMVFPAAGVWQGNMWVQGWGSNPDTHQLNYAQESHSVSNNVREYFTSEEWQPSFFSGVNSSFTNDVLADGVQTGRQRYPPGNCI